MISEAQALALLDEVNPVPDVEAYELSEADIAAHLATLIERSSEMTQLDSRPPTDRGSKSSIGWWIAAAAALIVLGVAVVLMTGESDEGDVVASTTATTLSEATPTTADTTPTTVSVEANRSAAETFVTALYTNDVEGLDSLAFSDADYKDEAAGGAALRSALNAEVLSPVSCEDMSPGLFRCHIGSIDDLVSALGLDIYEEVHIVSFTPTGSIEVSWQEPVDATVDQFNRWVFTNYPGTCGGTSESCAANLLSRIDEYLAIDQ